MKFDQNVCFSFRFEASLSFLTSLALNKPSECDVRWYLTQRQMAPPGPPYPFKPSLKPPSTKGTLHPQAPLKIPLEPPLKVALFEGEGPRTHKQVLTPSVCPMPLDVPLRFNFVVWQSVQEQTQLRRVDAAHCVRHVLCYAGIRLSDSWSRWFTYRFVGVKKIIRDSSWFGGSAPLHDTTETQDAKCSLFEHGLRFIPHPSLHR